MNDDELITAVKESVANAHMTIPAEQIISRSRAIRTRRRISGLAGALAVIVAAAITVSALPGRGTGSATTLTVRLLANRAAAAALSQPAVQPGQWVYREIKYHLGGEGHANGSEATWTTADGTRTHVKAGWDVAYKVGALPYSGLGSLPPDPAALEKYLGGRPLTVAVAWSCASAATDRVIKCPPPSLPRHMTPSEHASIAFGQIEGMLWDYALPPKLAAELFHALADIPGITVRRDATDIAGQHGVAFVLPRTVQVVMRGPKEFFDTGTELPSERLELILDPHSYRLMGLAETTIAQGTAASTREPTTQMAIVRQAYVSRPGVRP